MKLWSQRVSSFWLWFVPQAYRNTIFSLLSCHEKFSFTLYSSLSLSLILSIRKCFIFSSKNLLTFKWSNRIQEKGTKLTIFMLIQTTFCFFQTFLSLISLLFFLFLFTFFFLFSSIPLTIIITKMFTQDSLNNYRIQI